MITLKLILDKRRAKKNGSFPLIFRINNSGSTRDIPSGYSVLQTDWDEKNNKIKKTHPAFEVLAPRLRELEVKYLDRIIEFERANTGYIDIQQLKEFVIAKKKPTKHVKTLWQETIETMQKTNRHGGARVYIQALSVLDKVKSLDVPFDRVDYNFLKEVETALISRGTKRNSVGVYFRAFRAIYNQAINAKLVDFSKYPFRAFKIKKEPTVPHPISMEEMRKYFHLDLDPASPLYESWLIGKLIFLLAGINVADLFTLTEENLKAGRIIYFRAKTKRMYSIKVLPATEEIIAYFKQKGAKTLCGVLPDGVLENKAKIPYKIHEKNSVLRKQLAKVGIMIGCSEKIRSYTFRYSIANFCKQMGYNVQLISELLGHSYGSRVTGIYLETYDLAALDEMHEKVCNAVTK